MRPVKDWPGSRVAAMWLLWPGLLVAAVAGVAAIALWRTTTLPASPGGSAYGTTVWARLDLMRVLVLGAIVFGPPAVLTAIWAYARRRN